MTESHLPEHRERLYPPTVVLSMFMRQALNADGSCQKAVNGWAAQREAEGLSVQSIRIGAYCKARTTLAGADGSGADTRDGPAAERTGEGALALARTARQAGGRYRDLDAGYAREPSALSTAQ